MIHVQDEALGLVKLLMIDQVLLPIYLLIQIISVVTHVKDCFYCIGRNLNYVWLAKTMISFRQSKSLNLMHTLTNGYLVQDDISRRLDWHDQKESG